MSLLFSLLLSVSLFTSNTSTTTSRQAAERSALTALSTTFSVNNQTSAAIGDVTIHLSDQSDSHINVVSGGIFSTAIATTPTICIIHGQGLVQYQPTAIWLDEHHGVRMTWTSSIIVVDQTLTQ